MSKRSETFENSFLPNLFLTRQLLTTIFCSGKLLSRKQAVRSTPKQRHTSSPAAFYPRQRNMVPVPPKQPSPNTPSFNPLSASSSSESKFFPHINVLKPPLTHIPQRTRLHRKHLQQTLLRLLHRCQRSRIISIFLRLRSLCFCQLCCNGHLHTSPRPRRNPRQRLLPRQ